MLNQDIEHDIWRHTTDEYPKECCGVIVDGVYHPCENIAPDPYSHFEIDPMQYVELGDIQAIVHSHPNGTGEPSEMDKIQMGLHGVDWVIACSGICLVTGERFFDIKLHKFSEYNAPLLGREYVHGVQDCYTLVQDYFKRELNIELPNFKRVDDWWEDENHEPLYENNFAKAGFEVVNDIKPHDVILCRVGRTYHVNHALIFVGNGKLQSENTPDCVGDNLVLHHPHGALSRREIFGESWQKRTALIVRHRQIHKG